MRGGLFKLEVHNKTLRWFQIPSGCLTPDPGPATSEREHAFCSGWRLRGPTHFLRAQGTLFGKGSAPPLVGHGSLLRARFIFYAESLADVMPGAGGRRWKEAERFVGKGREGQSHSYKAGFLLKKPFRPSNCHKIPFKKKSLE